MKASRREVSASEKRIVQSGRETVTENVVKNGKHNEQCIRRSIKCINKKKWHELKIATRNVCLMVKMKRSWFSSSKCMEE